MTSFSLSDLKSKRAAMTQGERTRRPWPEFGVDGPDYPICTVNSDDDRRPLINEDKAKCDSEDVDGIVATHNAADVLIEIAEAALAMEAVTYGTVARKQAAERYYAALAKISP